MADAPDGWKFIVGFGWTPVDEHGRLRGEPIGAGWWIPRRDGKGFLFEYAIPEKMKLPNAPKLTLAEAGLLRLQLDHPGRTLKLLTPILAARLPERKITYAGVRKMASRLRKRGIVVDWKIMDITILSYDAAMTTPDGETIGGPDALTQLMEASQRGDQASRAILGKFLAAQREIPRSITDLTEDDRTDPTIHPCERLVRKPR